MTRAAIAQALGTIEKVAAYETQPDQVHEYAAWPVLRELNPDGPWTAPYVRSYDVYLVLPSGYGPDSAGEADEFIEPLVEALVPLGEWTPPAETVQLSIDATTVVPALHVRITPDQ